MDNQPFLCTQCGRHPAAHLTDLCETCLDAWAQLPETKEAIARAYLRYEAQHALDEWLQMKPVPL